jgi:hypothetical protein
VIKPLCRTLLLSALVVFGGTASAQTTPEISARAALTRLTLALEPLRRVDYQERDRRAFDDRLDELRAQISAARPPADQLATPRGEAWKALSKKVDDMIAQEKTFWAGGQNSADSLPRRVAEVSSAFSAAFPESNRVRTSAPPDPHTDQQASRAATTVQNTVKPAGAARSNPVQFFDGAQTRGGADAAPIPSSPSGPTPRAALGTKTDLPLEPKQTLHVNDVPSMTAPPPPSPTPKPQNKTLIALKTAAPGALHDAVAATPLVSPAARALAPKPGAAAAAAPAKPADSAQPAPTAESVCAETLKEHSSIATMCKDHPDIAPILGGMLDALKEQFGSVGAVAMNIGFMVIGLVLSALTGFGLIAKIAVSLVSFAMLIGTIYPLLKKGGEAVWDIVHSKDTDAKHAQALMSMGKVTGAVLIMALMAAIGWGAGKTSMGKNLMGGATDAITSKLSQLGLKDAMAGLDAKVPPFIRNFFRGTPAPAPDAKAPPPADTIPRSAKSKAMVDEQTVRDNANIKKRDARIDATMKQMGVDRGFAEKVADAHEAVPCAVGDCTKPQLRRKMEIMGDSPRSAEAIRRGLAGNAPAAKPVSLLETIDPATLPSAGKLHSPEQWGELVADTHDAGAKAVLKSDPNGTKPFMQVELANGEKVSGRFLGLDGDKMVFESDGKLVGVNRGNGVSRVTRLADAVFENGDRSPVETVVHEGAPVVDPFKDLSAYKGRLVDVVMRDLEDMNDVQTVRGHVVESDGNSIRLKNEKGTVDIRRDYYQVDSVSQHAEPYSSHGQISSSMALNSKVPVGTPVELHLPDGKTAHGLFRGAHMDEDKSTFVLLEAANGIFRAFREFTDLRTAPSAGGEVLYTHPAH